MKIFKRVLLGIVGLMALLLVADASSIWIVAHHRPEIKNADAAIILGAAINTPALSNRTKEGLQLFEEGKVKLLVLSGGKIADADISEAEYMEKVINKNASEPVEYILEENSHSTYDNIKNSKALLEQQGKDVKSVVIVSDSFHLARGVLLAKRAGFEDVYWAGPNSGYYSRKELRYYYFREFVAMINYIPKFIFG